MTKSTLAIWTPAASGLVLLALVLVDLHQFQSGSVGVRTLLFREIPVVLFGLASCLAMSVLALSWAARKQWRKAVLAGMSILVFVICFGIAGASGGAFLNAT